MQAGLGREARVFAACLRFAAHLQFESLAGFSAVVDRLGQFQEAMHTVRQPDGTASTPATTADPAAAPTGAAAPEGEGEGGASDVRVQYLGASGAGELGGALLELRGLSVVTPDGSNLLVQDLDLQVMEGWCCCLGGTLRHQLCT